MSKKRRYTNYSNFSKEDINDVPVEEAGQEEMPEESTYEEATFSSEPVTEEVEDAELVTEEVIAEPAIEVVDEPEPEIPLPEKARRKKGIVFNCEMVNVRKLPSPDAPIVSIIAKGEALNIFAEENGFYKVVTANASLEGYINKDFVSVE